jgi:hypothetical protein
MPTRARPRKPALRRLAAVRVKEQQASARRVQPGPALGPEPVQVLAAQVLPVRVAPVRVAPQAVVERPELAAGQVAKLRT